ncbi:MAG: PA14 domain-containing protein, partial [Bacteroidota bacterium]
RDAQLYYDYMVNPEPEYYYTFRYGNAQFFMIDTNKEVGEGSEQYDWLEWELAKSNAIWKFVVHHHPPYSSEENDHGDTYKGESSYGTHARNLVPLYETYGVDFCLFGHTHVYERTWPIFKDLVNQQEGVIYINSGGAGGGLEGFAPTRSWFSLEMQLVHHYCTFAIFDKTMVFKAIDHEGRVFDSFEMEKSADRLKRAEMITPPAPHIFFDKQIFQDQTTIRMEALYPSDKIYYTLDGSEPSLQSQVYTQPLVLTESASLNARVYNANGQVSRVVSRQFEQLDPLPAQKPGKLQAGLNFAYYEGSWSKMPNFDELEPLRTGTTTTIDEKIFQARDDHWAGVIEGYIELPESGTYQFFTNSDDGSLLYIDGRLVVDNSGNHGPRDRFGEIPLEQGYHHIRIEYFEYYGGEHLSAGFVDEIMGKKPFRPTQLGRQ